MHKLRIVIADDHALIREGLKRLVEAEPDMEVVGEAANGIEACDKAAELQPDVLLMDVSMPDRSGSDATRRVRRDVPATKIIALTVHEEASYLRDLLQAGAAGYVLKRGAPSELVSAIRAVARGGVYVDPQITPALLQFGAAHPRRQLARPDLSAREEAVIRLLAQGYSNKEIATQLELSVKTVETYKARSMEKLGLRSRVDLVKLAIERGWLEA